MNKMKYNIQVKRNKWTQIDIYIYIHIRDTLYKWYKSLLTVFAFAFLDECLILDILMAGLAVKPRAVKERKRMNIMNQTLVLCELHSPLDLIGTLCYKESLRVRLYFGTTRINGYLAVGSFLGTLDLNGQQQQL